MSDIRLFYRQVKGAEKRAGRAIGRAADLEFQATVGKPLKKRLERAIRKREQAIDNYERAGTLYDTALEHPEFYS